MWDTGDIAKLREMAVAGEGEAAIALSLKRRREDVRQMAKMLGLSLDPLAKREWCDNCAAWRTELDPDTGWCIPCMTRWRNERDRMRDDEEEARLREEAENERDAIKQQRKRMREEFKANPRKYRNE